MKRESELLQLPNYHTYLSELTDAINKQDDITVNQIFNRINLELFKIRSAKSVRVARREIMWNDPEQHFKSVEQEEADDLRREFDDNLSLFELANSLGYEPVMKIEFIKMVKNLSEIRKRTSVREARSEIMWSYPEDHFSRVAKEEEADLKNEIADLLDLYDIAKSANYNEGVELVTSRLNEIAPDLVESLNKFKR